MNHGWKSWRSGRFLMVMLGASLLAANALAAQAASPQASNHTEDLNGVFCTSSTS